MTGPDRAEIAERAARAGAEVADGYFRTNIDVATKSGKTDVVTRADHEAQDRVIEVIQEHFPGEAIVGEEGEELKSVPADGPVWIVDPIDGTTNYVRGVRTWATSVSAVVNGSPVAAATIMPAEGDAYVADAETATLNGDPISVSERSDPETFIVVPALWWPPDRRGEYAVTLESIVKRFGDVRRIGCAQGALAMIASGRFEGTITNVYGKPWDTVAGAHLIELAGGTVTDVEGNQWHPTAKGLVASNGPAHEMLLEAVDEVVATEA